MRYIVIPIFTDSTRHPAHDKNSLSLLYVKPLDGESEILTMNHLDAFQVDDFEHLKDAEILTLDKKILLHLYPFENVHDINLLHWWMKNRPLNIDDIKISAIDELTNRYYNLANINEIIPIFKHQQWCDQVAISIESVWSRRLDIDFPCYSAYNNDITEAFHFIEQAGIPISEPFDSKSQRHISDGKMYCSFNLTTTTGRPSNAFGGVNFAALDREKRQYIISKNDMLVEYDYEACHIRIIADLIDYELPTGPAHEHLAQQYGVDIDEGKGLTFRYLYGGAPKSIIQSNPFFKKVTQFVNLLWDGFIQDGFIETPIYKRKITRSNFPEIDKNRLFNYLIQATETEKNIKMIRELRRYLYKKKTALILYVYDSFLFDFSNKDGVETMKDIKKILERDNYYIRAKAGYDYQSLHNITERL